MSANPPLFNGRAVVFTRLGLLALVAVIAAGPARVASGRSFLETGEDQGIVGSVEVRDRLDLRRLRGTVADQPGLDAISPGRWLPVPDSSRPWGLMLETSGQFTDTGDLESEAGDVSVFRGGLEMRLDAAAIGELDWSVSLGYEYSSYDFTTGERPLLAGTSELVDDVQSVDLSWDFTVPLDEEWSLWGGVGALVAGESGADFSDMLNLGGRFGVAWQPSEGLALGLGLFVREDFAEGEEVLPLFLVDWRFAEDWSLSLEGSQLEVAWTPSDDLRLAGFFAFEIRPYALADDGIVPNGTFNDERYLAGLAVDWRPADGVLLRGAIGAVLSQEFDVEDTRGEDAVSIEGDGTGLLVSIGLTFTF